MFDFNNLYSLAKANSFTNLRLILFLFSISAFVLDLIFSVIFFKKYLKTKEKYLLYFALTLFLIYWTRLPFALSLIGFSFVIENFYLFFALTLPLYVAALIFLALGLRNFCTVLCQKRISIVFYSWLIVAFIALGYYFISEKAIFSNYDAVKTLYYVFLFPLRLAILLIILRTLFDKQIFLEKSRKIGLIIILINNILGAGVNFFNYNMMMHLPPQFWFLPVVGYSLGYIWEFFNSLLLIFGFLLIAKEKKLQQKD